ncbi:MAG: biotin--[acetyl-CoA-carboxylase] ligase [bacterium]|nr:biotin--[acetyl-CoA-carboxylase] ligase [bacterium]
MRSKTKLPGKKFTLTSANTSINAKILDLLRSKSHDFISGEQLSKELKMSRTAIWKHINTLRDFGYHVEAITSVGYKLVSSPSLLLPLEIKNGLKTDSFGKNIHWEYEVDSTNTLALKLAEEGASEGTVVVSELQKSGRGRMGRNWISQAESGIYMSIILRPKFVPAKAPYITFISAIALVESLQRVLDIEARIKWPNDVMIAGKKTAGILTELRAEMEGIHHIIVGIGINVNNKRFPEELRDKVTSLSSETEQKVSRTAVARAFLESLEYWYRITIGPHPEQSFERWQELSCTVGNHVEVNLGDSVLKGVATRLGPGGSLFVTLETGEEHEVLAGDVTMVARI